MTAVFLLVAFIGWFGGYHYGRNPHLATRDPSSKTVEIIHAPKWLFYLCGAPSSSRYLEGTLMMPAVRAQIMGVLLGVTSIVMEVWSPTRIIVLFAFGLSVCLPYMIGYYLYKRYKVKQ